MWCRVKATQHGPVTMCFWIWHLQLDPVFSFKFFQDIILGACLRHGMCDFTTSPWTIWLSEEYETLEV